MDRLPAETLADIVTYSMATSGSWFNLNKKRKPWQQWTLDDANEKHITYTHSIAKYATISKTWQSQVERITFAILYLTPARIAVAKAEGILTATRIGYIRSLRLEVVLGSYNDEAATRLESAEEIHRNNQVFTDTVSQLFSLLKPLDGAAASTGERCLHLSAYSPSDWESLRKLRYMDISDNIMERRYQHSYLEFLDTPGLDPNHILHMFSRFDVLCPLKRFFSPSACCCIAAQLHGIEATRWRLGNDEKKAATSRRRQRDDFAKNLHLLPKSLRDFALEYSPRSPRNHDFSPDNIVDGSEPDAFSVALRGLTKRLKLANFRGVSLTTDFWRSSSRLENGEAEGWPLLETLTVEMSDAEPTGRWLFSSIEEDEAANESRGSASSLLIRHFVEAGRAARKMPALQQLNIMTDCFVLGVDQYSQSSWPVCRLRYSVPTNSLSTEGIPVLEVGGELRSEWTETAKVHLGNKFELIINSKGK